MQMNTFYQPAPDSSHFGYKETEFDNLSDEELDKLINATGKTKVPPAKKPQPIRVVDLDALLGGDNG
jgi:hypothetical protein